MASDAPTPDPPSDIALLRRWVCDRDHAAFAEFERLYRVRIARWAWRRVSGYPDHNQAVEEVVQDTLLALARLSKEQIAEDRSLAGLIRTMTLNNAVSWVRARGAKKRQLTATSLTGLEDFAKELGSADRPADDELDKLRGCLDVLAAKDRGPVMDYYSGGVILAQLGLGNAGTALKRMRRILEVLRRCLESKPASREAVEGHQ